MKNLIENSTIHGITHIHSTRNKIYRTIWMLLFVFGVGGIVINVIIVSMKYSSYPISMSYTLNNKPFIWPEFTFCNPTAPFYIKPNSSNHRDWKNLLKDIQYWKKRLGKTQLVLTSADIRKMTLNLSRQIQHFEMYHDTGSYLNDKYENIESLYSYDLNQVTISSKMVTVFYNLPCHTIQLNQSLLNDYHRIQSLKLLFKLDYESYKIFNSDFKPRSLYLYINNANEISKGKPIILTPGYKYVLDIGQSRYRYLGIGRPCRKSNFTGELYDGNLQHTKLYEGNYFDCQGIMLQNYYMERCKCYDNLMPIPKNGDRFPRLCRNVSSLPQLQIQSNVDCLIKQINDTVNDEHDKICNQYKLDKCDSFSYKIDVQKDDYIDKTSEINEEGRDTLRNLYSQLYPKDQDNKDFIKIMRDNVLQIVVNRNREFSDLYDEQYAYNFSQLLSDVGGLMGLWLGMSVVGLFEMTQLLYFYMKNICKCQS